VPDALILIPVVALIIVALGLPLLVRQNSLVPDSVGFGILSLVVLGCAWGMGAWWIFVPILAIVGFVIWLDRGSRRSPEDGSDGGATLRLRLWRAAQRLQLVLMVCGLALFATGFGLRAAEPVIAWGVVMWVAAAAFRFSFCRACRHDSRTRSDAPEAMEPVA
jgi:hypothetical protein